MRRTDLTRLESHRAKDKERRTCTSPTFARSSSAFPGTARPVSCSCRRDPAVGDTRSKEDSRAGTSSCPTSWPWTRLAISRASSVQFSGSVGSTCMAGGSPITGGHHDLTHTKRRAAAGTLELDFHHAAARVFLTKLKNTKTWTVRAFSTTSRSWLRATCRRQAHSITNYPIIVAGGGSVPQNPGVHYTPTKRTRATCS